MRSLKEPVTRLDIVMDENDISSFSNLYYDFKGASVGTNARDAYSAVKFYQLNLEKTNNNLNLLSITESLLIYSIALYSITALLWAIFCA